MAEKSCLAAAALVMGDVMNAATNNVRPKTIPGKYVMRAESSQFTPVLILLRLSKVMYPLNVANMRLVIVLRGAPTTNRRGQQDAIGSTAVDVTDSCSTKCVLPKLNITTTTITFTTRLSNIIVSIRASFDAGITLNGSLSQSIDQCFIRI